MIQHRQPTSSPLTFVVKQGIDLFTTPLANPDPNDPPTSVVDDIETWLAESPMGTPTPKPGSITYTPLAILVGLYLLGRSHRPAALSQLSSLLLLECTPEQRVLLGMDADLSDTRLPLIVAGLEPDATHQQAKTSRTEQAREYARLHRYLTRITTPFDPSPFPRSNHKLLNKERLAIAHNTDHPRRRIDAATEALHLERLHEVLNKIVAASALNAPSDGYRGDIAADETIVTVLPIRYGHGHADYLKSAIDADAWYWNPKDDPADHEPGTQSAATSPRSGHGYGITLIVRAARPYDRQIPNVAVGIHVGRPTGGSVRAFATAHSRAKRHGLINGSRSPYVIADMGYSPKNGWADYLLEHGYRTVADYPKHWLPVSELADTDTEQQPAPGPVIVAGQILCPGARDPHNPFPELKYRGTQPEPPASIIERDRRIRLHQALTMPIKEQPRRLKSRPRNTNRAQGAKGRTAPSPYTHTITVQCPHLQGRAYCAIHHKPGTNRPEGLPDVPNPPHLHNPELRPKACRSAVTNYKLTNKQLKKLQALPWGSFIHDDYYQTVRSSNERFHSTLKNVNSGGLQNEVTQIRGIAKNGLIFAIAVSITNHDRIHDFHTKWIQDDGKAGYGPREHARRQRRMILKHQ